jgi:hypothetical protein
MRNLWRDTGLTIVLLPSGEQGDRLFSVAKLWTELKMLAPAMWVREELLKSATERPPRQTALVLGNELSGAASEVEVDLFEQLARQPLDRVRLLVVRCAVPDISYDQKQDDLVRILSDYLDYSMPTKTTGDEVSDPSSVFVKLNLITAPTEHQAPGDHKLVNPLFNANFIAASEDRATPMSGDAFVRYEPTSQKFAGFTMMHVASIGGLWSGLPEGTHELVRPGGWLGHKAFVSRVFLSAILTDGLARRASARVLESAGDAESGFVDLSVGLPIEGTVPIPDSEADKYISWMVDQVFSLDGRILQYQPTPEPTTTTPRDLTLLRQMVEFFKFSWDKLVRVPYFGALWLYRALVQSFNRIFQGGDKGAALIAEPIERMDSRDRNVLDKLSSVVETKKKADAAIVSPVSPSHLRSTPELWTSLRKLVFGMLDGSNLAHFGLQRTDNGWPVFYKVSSVFNDPIKTLNAADPANENGQVINLDWNSLGRIPELSLAYMNQASSLEAQNEAKLTQLVELKNLAEQKNIRLSALKQLLLDRLPKDETEAAED